MPANKGNGYKDANMKNPTPTQTKLISNFFAGLSPDAELPKLDALDHADADEPTPEEKPVAETVTDAVAEPVADPIFLLVDADAVKPKAGFETVLLAELANGPGTLEEIVSRLLASGEFARVAPKAAANRPAKPTRFLLKQWTAQGALSTL
jgi:hypothetical protein